MQKTVPASVNDPGWAVPVRKQRSVLIRQRWPLWAPRTTFSGLSGKCPQALSSMGTASVPVQMRVERILRAFSPKLVAQLGKLGRTELLGSSPLSRIMNVYHIEKANNELELKVSRYKWEGA